MSKLITAVWILVLCATGVAQVDSPNAAKVLRVDFENHAITPVTARFIAQAIDRSEEQQAACLVIVLDTPGGLLDATRQIVKRILDSRVPVIVYVAPPGARAASAGMFITLASHVSAMAPATNIGAATPVQMGGLPFTPSPSPAEKDAKQDDSPAMENKVVNDTVAWVRSLAELRGRNADWAERAVREGIAAPASEAVRQHIVDFEAADFTDLLRQLEGRQINLQQQTRTLHLKGAQIETYEMWWGERLLASLANPTVAFLLMIFGFYGVLLELYTPGWGVSGTIGAVCLVLAFLGFAVLPINYVGLALIAAGLTLLVAEAFVTSYGALAIAGTACLIFGGLMLVDSPESFLRVSAWVVIPVGVATATITVFLVSRIVAAHGLAPLSGAEGLLDAEALAVEEFQKEGEGFVGFVRAHGELWKAHSSTPVSSGQVLAVSGQHGLTLQVRAPGLSPGEVCNLSTETKRGDS